MLYPPFYIFPREFSNFFLDFSWNFYFLNFFPRENLKFFFRNNFEILVGNSPLKKVSLHSRKVTLNLCIKNAEIVD